MEVKINGKPTGVSETATSLSDLVASLGLATPGTAVALGKRIIPRVEWESVKLEEDMELTVIRAVCGG